MTLWTDLRGVAFEQRWIDAAGVKTRALVSGPPDAPALILLHGQTGHAEAYARNLGPHGQHFRTYALDMIGHGYTDKPQRSYLIEDYVEHLRAVLDAEGLASAAISGESLGGWVAVRFATQYPDRVDRLVLNTCGGYNWDENVFRRLRDTTLPAVLTANRETVRRRLEFLMADPARVTDELVEVRLAIYDQPEFKAIIERILDVTVPEIRRPIRITDDELRAIQPPTLVLWTEHDPTAPPAVGKQMADALPNATFVVMADCGHWPQWENPAEFNRIHIAFLHGQEVPATDIAGGVLARG